MKNKNILLFMFSLIISMSFPVMAQPFNDNNLKINPDHWTYQILNKLGKEGILVNYPMEKFKNNIPITKYEAVQATKEVIKIVKQNKIELSIEDKALINKLAFEFKTIEPKVQSKIPKIKSGLEKNKNLKIKNNQKILGSSSSKYNSKDLNRVTNIKLASKKINNFTLAPGKIFSFNQVVGARTPINGFKKAGVIVGEKLVKGYGGGICQVSSTLYNAVLKSKLKIIARTSHTLPISYYPKGFDATVEYGIIDFKFQNNTKNYLVIKSQASNNTITVKIIK